MKESRRWSISGRKKGERCRGGGVDLGGVGISRYIKVYIEAYLGISRYIEVYLGISRYI